jgi:sugar lactone lactonase YvrE
MKSGVWFAAVALLASCATPLFAQSSYPSRLDDPRAVYVTKDQFGAHADGVGDDADALQQASDRVQETTRQGVVFVPEGRYRLGKTVYVWQGIRLIGYGARRPVFVLGRNTPGFQEGSGHYMVHFADNRPQPGGPLVDASEFTFYSGMSNIDFELQDGNPAAVAIRFHVAQHSTLTHMDFHLGSALAALEDIGNQASDIHVFGGKYGILTKRTSPNWQFLLMDSSFDGQSVAAIHTQEVGFTLIRDRFAHVPVAMEIAAGEVEQLYGRDLQLEDVRTAAVALGNARNLRSEVTLTNVACSNVPHFVQGAAPIAAPSRYYVEDRFSIGLEIGDDGRERGIETHHRERSVSRPAPAVASDIPALPPMSAWVDVRTLGVKGDGVADDTAALRAAVDAHRVLYFPTGIYRLTGTLTLRPETILVGMNPGTTQLTVLDGTDGFQGDGAPVPLLLAPTGGTNIVTGIGIATGVVNPRAGGVVWMAGRTSMLEDMTFVPGRATNLNPPPAGRGFGGFGPGGARGVPPAGAAGRAGGPAAGRGGPPPAGRGGGVNYNDTQNPDLWVKDDGGGIFRGLWTHNTFAKAGFRVENTSTPSRVYQLSCEHHYRVETEFHNVRNWEIYALQTEEENPAGAEAIAGEIQGSRDVLFANTYMYRVSRNVLPKTYALMVRDSDTIAFENMKVFSQTRIAFDNAVFEEGSGVAVRARDFTHFVVRDGVKAPAPLPVPAAIFGTGAKLERVATGFGNASGLTADDTGRVFFTDAARHNIYRWNAGSKQAEIIAEIPGQPMVLGFVRPSVLLAVAYERMVYALDVAQAGPAQPLAETADAAPGTALLLPVGLHNQLWMLNDLLEHRGYLYRQGSNTAVIRVVSDEHRGYFYAPGTTTAIMAGGTWRPLLQSSQLAVFSPGDEHPLTSEDDGRTYTAKLESSGKLTTSVFAERGGTSVVTDAAGNVYVASGQVYIYDRTGRQIGILEVPERPSSLTFGGADRHTLFIGARTSMYAIRTVAAGR